jgi:hypothetical protein
MNNGRELMAAIAQPLALIDERLFDTAGGPAQHDIDNAHK